MAGPSNAGFGAGSDGLGTLGAPTARVYDDIVASWRGGPKPTVND
jgi:hypothetical protein